MADLPAHRLAAGAPDHGRPWRSFSFLRSWNNYLWPLLINSTAGHDDGAGGAWERLIGLTKVSWGGIMAGAVLLTAPILVIFVALAAPLHRRHRRRRNQIIGDRRMAELALSNVVKRFGGL